MDMPEADMEKAERYKRLIARLIRYAEAGEPAEPLREQLHIAMMMSPLPANEQLQSLVAFDAAVMKALGA